MLIHRSACRGYSKIAFPQESGARWAGDQSTCDTRSILLSVPAVKEDDRREGATTRRLLDLMKETPALELEQWGGITLPGGGGKASLMMAIAGKTAPDIGEAWFHIIGSEIRNGFLHPLNEWIGEDTDGNGIIDDDETTWEPWKQVPPLWRRVAMLEGKVYGIPQAVHYHMGVVFRTDMVRAAGLNPNAPPQTWDEFMAWCHKLTDPAKDIPGAVTARGQRGMALAPRRITVSTAGVVPKISELIALGPISLAVSLHATTDAVRDVLVPINKKFPLKVLLDLLRSHSEITATSVLAAVRSSVDEFALGAEQADDITMITLQYKG